MSNDTFFGLGFLVSVGWIVLRECLELPLAVFLIGAVVIAAIYWLLLICRINADQRALDERWDAQDRGNEQCL